MMMPELGRNEGDESDRKQHAGEGQTAPEGEHFPQVRVRAGLTRCIVRGVFGGREGRRLTTARVGRRGEIQADQ